MKQLMNLNGDWTLYVAPNATVKQAELDAVTAAELEQSGFTKVPAQVPGNFELDLQRAGLFPDPFWGTNPLLCQKEENKHLWYTKRFTVQDLPDGEPYLRFEGIDTFAEIYLNGSWIGSCDNMLIEHEYAADGLRLGENELVVHIFPTAIVAREYEGNILNGGQKYNLDSIHIRKAPYMFGWDIMPRTVSGGLWRSVTLTVKPTSRLEEFYITTAKVDMEKNVASLAIYTRLVTDEDLLNEFELVVTGQCGDSKFEQSIKFWSANRAASITLPQPKLWWPRNAGEQNLYEVETKLYLRGELCDTYTTRLGIRTVALDRTSVIDENGNGKFEFIVNGKKIFILGTNWVPLDAFPSQNEKRLQQALEMVEDIGCNMVRLWGGNVYECDAFYDWCDEHGIMLWQDFIMGCAYYPQYREFQEALREEAIVAVKRLRSHASLVLWAGDNECDALCGRDLNPNDNVLTRKVLPEVLMTYDPYRPFLPSSPYVDEEAYATKRPLSEQHIWGPRNYFKSSYYLNATCRFASETGFHGCPSPDSLKKYIGKEHLWPNIKESGRPDEEWTVHAASMEIEDVSPYEYRISLMNRQVVELFGQAPKGTDQNVRETRNSLELARLFHSQVMDMFGTGEAGLDGFAKASQIFQAEAFKFIIERFRIRKATHGGLIWWNLVDGWPQISDAVVDYYFCKKLAYDYIANSQQPLCLMFDEPENGRITLYAPNDLPVAQDFTYTVTRVSDGQTVLSGSSTVEANGIATLGAVDIRETEKEWYLMEWQTADGKTGRNHYVSNIRGISYDTYTQFLNQTSMGCFEGFSEEEKA